MKKPGLGLCCALLLGACSAPSTPAPDDFTGHWSGTLTANYNCKDGTSDQVVFTSLEFDISQSGSSDSVLLAFCNGIVIDGTASGNELDVTATTDISCTLSVGSGVTINDFSGGSFTFDGSQLDVSLNEDVSLTDSSMNATTCSGAATGKLSKM
jgi:hypothetical protein